MGDGELLKRRDRVSNRRRERYWNYSDVFWEEDVVSLPKLGVSKDSRSVERFYSAHSCHLLYQPCLRFFIGYSLCDFRHFPSHPSCVFGFL